MCTGRLGVYSLSEQHRHRSSTRSTDSRTTTNPSNPSGRGEYAGDCAGGPTPQTGESGRVLHGSARPTSGSLRAAWLLGPAVPVAFASDAADCSTWPSRAVSLRTHAGHGIKSAFVPRQIHGSLAKSTRGSALIEQVHREADGHPGNNRVPVHVINAARKYGARTPMRRTQTPAMAYRRIVQTYHRTPTRPKVHWVRRGRPPRSPRAPAST